MHCPAQQHTIACAHFHFLHNKTLFSVHDYYLVGKEEHYETVDTTLFWRQLGVAVKYQGPHLQLVNCGLSICLRLNLP